MPASTNTTTMILRSIITHSFNNDTRGEAYAYTRRENILQLLDLLEIDSENLRRVLHVRTSTCSVCE